MLLMFKVSVLMVITMFHFKGVSSVRVDFGLKHQVHPIICFEIFLVHVGVNIYSQHNNKSCQ